MVNAMLNEPIRDVESSCMVDANFRASVPIWQPFIPWLRPGRAGLYRNDHKARQSLPQIMVSFRCRPPGAGAKALLDIVDDDLLKVGGDGWAAQRHRLLAVDEDRRRGLLASAG